MANPSKRKGDGFERECVERLLDGGVDAEKVPLSGAIKGGSFEGDIICRVQGEVWKIECKRRKRAFGTLYGYLGTNKALFLRDDKTEPLVLMRLEDWTKLAVLS